MAKRAATSDGRSPASTSTIRPCAGVSPCGRLVISTITLSPSFAPCAERAAISTEYQCPGSSGSTRPCPMPACQMPPMRFGASPMRRIRRATRRPRSFIPTARTSTRSPCIRLAVSARASSSAPEASSGITSTSPLERPRTSPARRSASLAVANPFGPSIACPSRTMAARRFARASRCSSVRIPRRFARRSALNGSGASERCLSSSSRLAIGLS